MPKSRGRLENGAPNPIDVHIGARIKLRRKLLRISQMELAQMLGITFQQVQKYERGNNRISGSRLWDVSQVLNVPVSFFFEDLDAETISQSPRALLGMNAVQSKENHEDPFHSAEAIKLLNAYFRIKNPKIRKSIFGLLSELK